MRDIAAPGHEAAPRLTFVGSTAQGISGNLDTYRAQGTRRLVVLRGDLPNGTVTGGEIRYASDLIEFVREPQGSDWFIEVEAYPECHAQQRARREIEQRLQQALERLPELEQIKRRNGSKAEDARASSTDADASVMKMADGGYRPAVNARMACDSDSQVIVGLEVSSAGSDMARLAPMVDQVGQRCGKTPEQWQVDGGFPAHEQIEAVANKTEVYAPLPEARPKKGAQGNEVEQDKHAPKPDDSPAVAQWRQRTTTPKAKELYKLRPSTAECVNAHARNRGLQRMPVRGLGKMRCEVLLFALAHNLMRTLDLAPQLMGLGPTPSAQTLGTA